MTLQKQTKKVNCCGCFDWLFARRAHHSPLEDLDSTVEEIKNTCAEDDAGEQGQGSLGLACLNNTAQPLVVVEEDLPSDTQNADGDVGKGEMEGSCKKPPTLVIIVHMVKRERVSTPVDGATVAEKDWTPKESHGKRIETLIITLHLVKRETIKEVCEELPSEHQDTAGDAQPLEGVKEEVSFEQEHGVVSEAVNEPAEKTPLKSCFKKKEPPLNPAQKVVRFNFQNLNSFVKDRELYCGYDYCKYGFSLSMIRSELQELKETTVKPQRGPVQDAVNKHDTSQEQTVGAAACTTMNTTTEGKSPKGILKKEKMPRSTCPKLVRFNLGNLRAPVKERELYHSHDYFRYAAPLQATQAPNVTSRLHQQPVRSASNLLRGAPRHLGRPTTQRSNDSFQQNSGRNAEHNYTNSRHSQHRQHNSSSHVSPRYETRYYSEGQANPGTNSRSRSRVKRGAKPGDGDFL